MAVWASRSWDKAKCHFWGSQELFYILNNILVPLYKANFTFCWRASVVYTANVCFSILCMEYFQVPGWDQRCPCRMAQ